MSATSLFQKETIPPAAKVIRVNGEFTGSVEEARASVLNMTSFERLRKVNPATARELGFVCIDGVGGDLQFIGTEEEYRRRMASVRPWTSRA